MSYQQPRRPLARGRSHNQSRTEPPRKHNPDYLLILLSVALLAIGLIVVYAISPGLSAQKGVGDNYFVSKQLTAIALGLVVFTVLAIVPYGKWRKYQKHILIVASVATLVALLTPVSPDYPAHRWIRIGGFSLQSVELVKLAIIVGMGLFFERQIKYGEMSDIKKTLKPIAVVLAITGVVIAVLQRDFGSTAVIIAMLAAMAFVAGLPLVRVVQGCALVMLAFLVLILPFSYRRDRIATFTNPERDCQNEGYQACQALIAVGSGGLFGIGLQNSGQAFGYLPEAANDSIFAIFAEKFGFLGSTFLICLFAVFFTRIKKIMERAPDDFSRLVVAGIMAWLSMQTIINIGAMIGILPLKGITLPFISYGGTSVVFVMAAIGLVFNISRYTSYAANRELGTSQGIKKERIRHENSADWRRNRRSYNTNSSRRA